MTAKVTRTPKRKAKIGRKRSTSKATTATPEKEIIDKPTPPETTTNMKDIIADKPNDFTANSPLLSDEVISRNDAVNLSAEPLEELPPMSSGAPKAKKVTFMKPEEAKDSSASSQTISDANVVDTEDPELPTMKVDGEPITEDDIKKKVGQTTAEYTWILFEKFFPQLQASFAKFDEIEIKELVEDKKVSPASIDFCKEFNESIEDEAEIKAWEKELIYPAYCELMEEKGMNASLSPTAKLAMGLSAVMFLRAKETIKYRKERDYMVQKFMRNYEEANPKAKTTEIPLMPTEEVKSNTVV